MGLKKRNKVSAEFSMSSLTDIIFLLLIFFMLTATFIQIHNVELPESDSKTVASTALSVTVNREGEFYLNGQQVPGRSLESGIRQAVNEADDRAQVTITIVAETGVPFENVSRIMQIASDLKLRAIIATQPRKG